MPELMYFKQPLEQEGEATVLTLIRILPRMMILMHEKTVGAMEIDTALGALVRIRLTVNKQMRLEGRGLAEGFTADLALVRFLPRVGKLVPQQIGLRIEGLAALCARVGSLPRVRQHVVP